MSRSQCAVRQGSSEPVADREAYEEYKESQCAARQGSSEPIIQPVVEVAGLRSQCAVRQGSSEPCTNHVWPYKLYAGLNAPCAKARLSLPIEIARYPVKCGLDAPCAKARLSQVKEPVSGIWKIAVSMRRAPRLV